MDATQLYFIPLGGTGEIGMNLNAYRYDDQWLLIDCGVMFVRRTPTESDATFATLDALNIYPGKIAGLILTHAHQDHIGAVADLWPQLQCPVYGTRFTIEMLNGPLKEVGLGQSVPMHALDLDARFRVGPFDLQRIPLTHSTVEMGAFVIRTEAATVLHTGDWTFDSEPVVGQLSDQAALMRLHDEPIHALVCDSTNATTDGWTASEGSLRVGLRAQFTAAPARIAVTLFSSNIARLQMLVDLANETSRSIILMGHSLIRTVAAAQRSGYLQDMPVLIEAADFGYVPPTNVLLICTGSQGDPRAALTRLAEDRAGGVYLEKGDTVLFSARRIPGCEEAVDHIQSLLVASGVHIVDDQMAEIHVSGHARRDELRQMYHWVAPLAVIPVHGTPRHLDAHADLVTEMGIDTARIRNGDIVHIGTPLEIVDTVQTGRMTRANG